MAKQSFGTWKRALMRLAKAGRVGHRVPGNDYLFGRWEAGMTPEAMLAFVVERDARERAELKARAASATAGTPYQPCPMPPPPETPMCDAARQIFALRERLRHYRQCDDARCQARAKAADEATRLLAQFQEAP